MKLQVRYNNYTPEEVESRGEALYRDRVRQQLGGDDLGKFVVIDVESGDYEVADDDLAATKRLLAKRPDAVLYGVRVGYPTAYMLGGHAAAPKS